MIAKNSKRPICLACHRPFDPSSPGATATLGPTCAKKTQMLTLDDGDSPQLSFMTADERAAGESVPLKRSLRSLESGASPRLPPSLLSSYQRAKLAFDELYRTFCHSHALSYGNEAQALYQALMARGARAASLTDPVLTWLEPEHDLSLLFERDSAKIYHWRVLNGTATLLELSPLASDMARTHVKAILDYEKASLTFHEHVARLQPSLTAPSEARSDACESEGDSHRQTAWDLA